MVNKKLRYFRIQCNLTQQEIAKEIGVKRTKVAKWEAGLEEIDEENYKHLAKLFGVSVRRLKGKADKIENFTGEIMLNASMSYREILEAFS